MPRRFRRASSLILYWAEEGLVCEDYLTRRRAAVTPEVAALLDWFGASRRLDSFPGGSKKYRAALASLRALGFLRERPSAAEKALGSGWHWGAAARHFLFSTKDAHRPAPLSARLAYARALRRAGGPPPRYKNYPGARRFPLPGVRPLPAAAEALAQLRNTRSFRLRPMPLAHLGEILRLAWGRRGELQTPVWGPLVDKTSYSAGNRHPVEVYPVVAAVEGLKSGVYHYNVRGHCLELLKAGSFARELRRIGNEQPWIKNASVYFLMTAVLKRTMWKYRNDYALRTVFCDVGHLSQSLYLAAQSLGWGACTTYALDHSRAERLLGVDGTAEPFLALSMAGARSAPEREAGVGVPPRAYDDLDGLIGSWVADPEIDKALSEQRVADPRDWR